MNLLAPDSPILLPLLILLWHGGSLVTNSMLKVLLNAYPNPLSWSVAQFACQALCSLLLSTLNGEALNISEFCSIKIWPTMSFLAAFMLASRFLHEYALSLATVSFVHTVKTSGPLFAVVLGYVVMGEGATLGQIFSVLLIVIGVGLTSLSTTASSAYVLFVVLAGTFVHVMSSVLMRKSLVKQQFGPIVLLFYTNSIAFVAGVPLGLVYDGFIFREMDQQTLVYFLGANVVLYLASLAAVSVMAQVTALTYSILGVMKRAMIIFGSLIIFGTVITTGGKIGLVFVFCGALSYAKAKTEKQQQKDTESNIIIDLNPV